MHATPPRPCLGSSPLAATRLSQVRAGIGLVHLFAPGLGGRQLVGQPFEQSARLVIRTLGVRQLAQAVVTVAAPDTLVLSLGAGVDATHAATMLALVLFSRRWRRAALVEVVIAATLASVGVAAARTAPPGVRATPGPLPLRASGGLALGNFSSLESPVELGGGSLA